MSGKIVPCPWCGTRTTYDRHLAPCGAICQFGALYYRTDDETAAKIRSGEVKTHFPPQCPRLGDPRIGKHYGGTCPNGCFDRVSGVACGGWQGDPREILAEGKVAKR
jgi:hypothetical protein